MTALASARINQCTAPTLGFKDSELRVVVLQDLNLGVAHAVLIVCLYGQALLLDNQIKLVVDSTRVRHYRPYYSINEKYWWLPTFLETYRQERRRLATEAVRDRGAAEQRLSHVQPALERIVEAIAETGISSMLKEKLLKLEAEVAELRQRVKEAAQVTEVPELHPAAIEEYRRLVSELQAVLAGHGDDGARERMRAILRRLVWRIEVLPGDKRGQVSVRLIGELNELVQLTPGNTDGTETMVTVVAGRGFEPLTFRL